MHQTDPARPSESLRTQTGAFADTVAGLGPDAPVPTCPQWRVRDLVGHVGQAHRWAAGIVRTGAPAAAPDPRATEPGGPENWPAWLAKGAAELVDAVTETGPDRPVWTFLDERPARFWPRRMLNDLVVHSADAAFAAGVDFDVPAELAEDCITETLELIGDPTAARLKSDLGNLRGAGQTLQFRPIEEPGWLITRTPNGPTWARTTADADVVVTGPVPELLLVFSRRRSPAEAEVTVTGDEALLAHWLANTSL
jgi:uncharacterized protein (TIGR03083 family)